ncbi:PAS domain S-box protein [Luteolibacter sp. Populi]|uniref:PAS domain S-box protein n=1 Tax=Luteolibacter sp. Populi TaxID=3230487 RepID=UPI0034656061
MMNDTMAGESREQRERRWVEAFWAGQAEALDLILSGHPVERVLDRIARRIEEASADGALCSIFLADAEGTRLTLAAAPGLPEEYRHATREMPILEGCGSCGSAAALRKMVVVEDITTHPDWASARELVLRHGLRACWSVPVFSAAGDLIGTMGIYYRENRLPEADERLRVESAAKLIGLAIERGRAADKMRADETLLRIAGQNARLGGWTVDLPEGRITWSAEVCAIHDVPPGHIPGFREAFDYYAPDARPAIRAAFESCAKAGTPFDEELPMITATGRLIQVRSIGEAVRDGEGRIIRIQGACQDLTARREAEEAGLRVNERLTHTLESLTEGFLLLAPDWRYSYLNREAERMLQRDRASLLGKVMWDEFPETQGSHFEHELRRAVEEGRPVDFENFYPPLQTWFEIRALPVDDGLALYFRDITALRKSREQVTLLAECVSRIADIVIITEADPIDEPGPRILFVNDAFTEGTGYTAEEALGRSPRFLQGPKTQRGELDRIRLAIKKGEPVRAELINYKKNGQEMWLEIDVVPVKDATGGTAYLVAVQRDVTARKHAEEESRLREERYVRQRNSLITLAGIQPLQMQDTAAAFRRINEAHARALGVSRVGIWLYEDDRSLLRCADLFETDERRHSSGLELHAADCPGYLAALEDMDVIAADDARTDPRTRDFAESYLRPVGIYSMMDAPISVAGNIVGVMCSEQTGAPRTWTGDEKTFAASVANLVALALEGGDRHRAESAVQEIRQRFEIVAGATNDAVWDWDLGLDELWWNEGFEKLFGYRREEIERSSRSWTSRIHPDDEERVITGIRGTIDGTGDHWSSEFRFRRADGTYAYVLDRGVVMRDSAGRGIRMVGGMSDLSSRKQAELDLARLNRALKMLSACNEAVTRAEGEIELLNEICRMAVATGGYRMAWVGYARHDADHWIEPLAFAGVENGYLAEIRLTWDGNSPTGQGPAGRTIRGGEAVVCRDIEDESAMIAWLPQARERGYRGVICLPLRDGERVFGLLSLHASEVFDVRADEIKLLQELADDVAFGIGTLRAREERRRTSDIVVKVAQAVSSGTGSEFFDLLTRNMVEALGAHGGLVGRLNKEDLSITPLSFVLGGEVQENVTYSLHGTPCANVSDGNVCVFDRNVQQLFPEDHLLVVLGVEAYAGIPLRDRHGEVAGIMVVLFSAALEESMLVQSTLQIFAARAAGELDRQQSDERIREQASLLDRARDAIMVQDPEHRISYWNKSAERLYGWTREEVAGRPVEDLLYRDTTVFREAFRAVLTTGEWVGELEQIDRLGRELVIEARWTLLRGAEDKPPSILSINTDVTEHKKLEQQFLRAQRLESIGTLAGGIAHDLNNVLAPISMSIELLRSEIRSERGEELLATLAASANRGAEMVNQVLSFARGMEGRRVELHARRLVEDLEKIVRDTFPKNIVFRSNVPRTLMTFQGDPTQLHQVLLNLCVNARDAMPEGGQITISAENVNLDDRFAASESSVKAGPHVLIRVEDTGHGIPAELLDKIFEPFFTTKAAGKGTGLGLSTSMAIVRSHGGFIRAASNPGNGTCFLIVLPASGEETANAEDGHAHLPRGNGETILVADDEPSIRRIMEQMLVTFGYRVLLAGDGAEAVEIYREQGREISVVITDMMMPVLDGLATIRQLTCIDPAVKIIAASGISNQEKAAKESGANVRYFITKPCTAETLLTTLKATLSETGT